MSEKDFNFYTKQLNVVFAEDDELVRKNLVMIFNRFFNSVYDFEDGKLAFDFWSENREIIDLVITDITMPSMNGIELSKKIKEVDPEFKILVISAHNDVDKLFELINIGVDGFVTKPPQKAQLSQSLSKIGKIITERKELEEYQQKLEEQINLTNIAHRVIEHRMQQKATLLNAMISAPLSSVEGEKKVTASMASVHDQLQNMDISLPPPLVLKENKHIHHADLDYLLDDVAEMRDIIDDIDYAVIKLFSSQEISFDSEFFSLLERLVGRYAKYSFILKSYQPFQFLSDKLFELSCVLREFLNPDAQADIKMVGDFLECMTYSLLMFQSQVIEEKKVDPNFYDASLSNDIDTIITIMTHNDTHHHQEELIEFF